MMEFSVFNLSPVATTFPNATKTSLLLLASNLNFSTNLSKSSKTFFLLTDEVLQGGPATKEVVAKVGPHRKLSLVAPLFSPAAAAISGCTAAFSSITVSGANQVL